MKLHLSKSKYCRGYQCPKMLWMDFNKPEEAEQVTDERIFENGTAVGKLARALFGDFVNIDRPDSPNANFIMLENTQKALKDNIRVITEASFEYDNNFCSVDILKNFGEHVEIYEVKSSTSLHEIYKDDAAYQYFVLSNAGYNVTKVCLVHLNSGYERHGKLELDKLFSIEDYTDIAIEKQKEISEVIARLNEVVCANKEEPDIKIGMQCKVPYQCQYWSYCTKGLPCPNVFDLKSQDTHHMNKRVKFDLLNEGKVSFEDLKYENLPKDTHMQIDHELNDKEAEFDVGKIREFMSTLSYPIYFLDFESYQKPIPEYDGMRPYEQVPFQYSLHYVLEEGGEIFHREFFASPEEDPRRKLAEQLVKDIPMDVCVTAYNMTFEKTRIKRLAEFCPDLADHLLNIKDNIKDFLVPFRSRAYYTKAMQGSASIKYVLPALFPNDPSLDYHNLPLVHNGTEASRAFLDLPNKTKEEQDEIIKSMLKYCELDTYAMVKIWEKLKEISE